MCINVLSNTTKAFAEVLVFAGDKSAFVVAFGDFVTTEESADEEGVEN